MPTEFWFPTPIYYHQFSGKQLAAIQGEIDRAYPTYTNQLTRPWDDQVLTTFNYSKLPDFLKDTPLLKDKIREHIVEFIGASQAFTFYDSWINVSSKHGYQNYHYHNDSTISGVYYYRTSGGDGAIKFKPESIAYQDSKLISLLNVSKTITYQPAVGKLLLFPSFLQHAVLMNTTEQDRISISFNIRLS
jgi:uncharacterized protein (TIGR02466 family)